MSVPNQTPYIIYNANGLTTVFPFEFYIINSADLQVSINGTMVTSGYSVSGAGNVGGGDVTFITPPASGSVVMLERVVPTYRLTDYQDNGDLLADTVNKDFDRLWMAIQRSFIYLGLALRRPLLGGPFDAEGYRVANLGDPINQQDAATKNYVDNVSLVRALRVPENFVPVLPPADQRANKLLAFNAEGQPITVLPESGSASDVLIELAKPTGAARIGTESGADAQDYFSAVDINTVTALMSSNLPAQIKVVRTSGYYDIFGKRDIWVRSAETAAASQTPLQLNKLAASDATGSVWYLDISDGRITVESIGAKADGVFDCWAYFELCLKNAEQGTNRVVTGIGINYLTNKPLILKTGRHLEFNAHLGVDIIYGGDVLTEQDAPSATTPVGTDQTSVFSGKKAQVIVVHASQDYARYFSLKNVYIKCKPGVTADYGVYCPFGNQFDFSSVQNSDCLVGLDSRDLYTGSFTDVFFSAPTGVMGTVGFNLTPIENGRGAGTSLIFTRVGILNFRFSWYITELNYANFLSCYTEGSFSRYCARLERCNGIVFNAYGCERLTQVGGDGRLFVIIDSQTTINALQASYNVNLSGTQGISISGNSQVTISEPYFVTVGSTYTPFQTDNTSRVRIFGFKWAGVTPGVNVLGQQTVMYGEPGRTECVNFPGNWNGGFIRIGSVRLWDDGVGLRIKRGSDPANVSDGTSL